MTGNYFLPFFSLLYPRVLRKLRLPVINLSPPPPSLFLFLSLSNERTNGDSLCNFPERERGGGRGKGKYRFQTISSFQLRRKDARIAVTLIGGWKLFRREGWNYAVIINDPDAY